MKRFLLLISVMLVTASFIKAQDVYYSGFYTKNSQKWATVYKNNTKLYEKAIGDYDNISTSVAVNPSNNDVYWTRCNENYGDVIKNDEVFLNNTQNTYIYNLYWSTYRNKLYAAGYKKEGDIKYAVVWENGTIAPYMAPNFGNGKASVAYDVIIVPEQGNYSYYCGYANQTTSGTPRATIWRASEVLYTIPEDNSYALSLDFYDGDVYTAGRVLSGSNYVIKVWKNDTELYTLTNSASNADVFKIKVDCGDVYVVGWGTTRNQYVWKNGEVVSDMSSGGATRGMDVNSTGYYAGKTANNGDCTIFKNGTALYSSIANCEGIYDLYVTEKPKDNSIRTLPYSENFEIGETDWTSWTTIDVDNDNAYSLSFWHRAGSRDCSSPGDYCARHRGKSNAQEGWLISPRLFLQPGRDATTLEFKSWSGSNTVKSVLVSTGSNPTATSSYTEVWTSSDTQQNWTDISVNLSAYQGQNIYIAFKYSCTDGNTWLIDNVSVTEDWVVPSAYNVPYIMSFDQNDHQEPGYCWYIIDNDHSGEVKNWKWNSSENCAYHPWGQQNMPQEGWMFSPSVTLPSGHNYQLSFLTKNNSSGAGMNSSVWIALDENGTPDPAHYTTKLWEESTASSWHSVNIDLTEYAGHEVRIAFKYEGTYAHAWYVDDFAIEQNTIQYNINVVANNASWGTVTGGGTYDQGADVTITAEPNSGYDFLKWTKDGTEVSTDATYSFTATEDATYTAVFGEQSVTYYTITTAASPADAGTVEGGGTYEDGATVILAASANPGWQFVQWTDGNADNPRNITVTGDATYTAQFTQINYVINVDAVPYEGGSVTGGGTYHYGDAVTLTATPNEGYDFLQWDNGETALTRTVIVDGDANYTAYFAEQGTNTYEIAVFTNDPELGTVSGGGVYPEGTVITISATPIGYASFVRWDDGDTNATRTITVTADASYTAIFEMGALYTITVESLNPTMGSVAGGGEFPAGAEIMIQATPFGGYHFDGWDDNVYENPRMVTVTGNATYKARFSEQQQETYHITVLCNDPNAGTVYGTGDYPAGATATLVAVPNSGYRFKEWNDGVTDQYRTITVTANATYFATFEGDGIDENGMQTISLYPNPANDVIRLEGIGENTEVRIYNAIGALVKVVNVSDDEEIFVSDLKAGLYIVRSGNTMLKFTKK